MSTFGTSIIVNLFGESHGKGIGITIHNFPAGIELDLDQINYDLSKRRPKSSISTSRREQDVFQILSGYFNNKTTGAPITFFIPNEDTQSKDYTPELLRPSHADYTAYSKHNGYSDYRGGGHFSGRLTATLVILGSICNQILTRKNIFIGSHIFSIKDKKEVSFLEIDINHKTLETLQQKDFPTISNESEAAFKATILNAKENQDSVGGIVETAILGLAAGYGTPFFDSIESTLSHLLFSIPSVKGVSFGKGFDITTLYGSEANDQFIVENGSIKTTSNNSGGIQGGISNGMPIIFKTAIKPTASIAKSQNTVNITTMENTSISLQGRHDPCIVHRAAHVINAITAYGILEMIVREEGLKWMIN